jgi:hypothetical protein
MHNGATLTIYGAIVDPGSWPIDLPHGGWWLASYLRLSPMPVETALSSLDGVLTLAKNGRGEVYWPAYSIDQIDELGPGQGYQLYLSGPGELHYPDN